MKLSPSLLFVALCLLVTDSVAQESQLPEQGVSAQSSTERGFQAPRGRALDDWVDPRTGNTTRFFSACEVSAEFQLSTTGYGNFLDVTLLNFSERPIAFRAQGARVQMNGVERFLQTGNTTDEMLQSGWWYRWSFAFPDKEAFREANEIEVILPFNSESGECEMRALIERDRSLPRERASYMPTGNFDTSWNFGSRLLPLGGQKDAGGDYRFMFGMSVAGYGWAEHHGLAFDFDVQMLGTRGVSRIQEAGGDAPDGARLTDGGVYLGYSFKYFVHRGVALNYALLGGTYLMEMVHDGDSEKIKFFGGFKQRLKTDIFVLRNWSGGLTLSPTIYHLWIPRASFLGLDISGHTIGAALGIGISG